MTTTSEIFSRLAADTEEERFLAGKLLFIPEELRVAVEQEDFKIKKKELIWLVWTSIKSTPAETSRSGWRRVHHKRFNYQSSYSTDREAVLWLAENGFIKLDEKNSYYADDKNGYPKKYKLIAKSDTVFVELKNKSLLDGPKPFTQPEPACEYTRKMLDKLEVDREAVKIELRRVIAHYREQKEEEKRVSGKRKKTKKKRKDKIPELDVQTFGLPLLQLINRRGAVKRGPKGNRLYSPIASVKKVFRQYFMLEGEPLVWLDMQAAHPTLLGNLSDDQNLVKDCLSDEFYGRIMSKLGVDRDTAKKRYMAWAYDRHRPKSRLTGVMETHYAQAASYVIKHKPPGKYQRFSWQMQKTEADIFIDSVYGQLAQEKIPAISVHDSLGTTSAHKERVKKLLLEELTKRRYKAEIKEETYQHTI